jgi:hypothetical protein
MKNNTIEKEIPSVRSRAYRCLTLSKHYHGLHPDSPSFDVEYAKQEYPIHLNQGEHLVGVYENKFGDMIFELPHGTKIWDTIVLTNQTLNLCCNSKCEETIYFNDIVAVSSPNLPIIGLSDPIKRGDGLILHISLPNRIIDFAIIYGHGEYGRFKDVWLWSRFLKSYEKSSS